MITSNDITVRVRKVLVEALGVDEDDITPSARLQADLGAESIDFLDIVFRLEREFMFKIPQGELFPAMDFPGDSELVIDGQLTDEGLATLRSRMPYADLSDLNRDHRLNGIDDLFTVDLLLSYIAWKLGEDRESDRHVRTASLIHATSTIPDRSH